MRILVVNAGSSSLKLRVLGDGDAVVARVDLGSPDELDTDGLRSAVEGLGHFEAVGHRFVHGGTAVTGPARLDDATRRNLEALVPLAPLHQAAALRTADLVARLTPEVPAVACVDTAFHAHLPPEAATYAVPGEWRDRLGLRRYGFHGLSHAYAARRAHEMAGTPGARLRVVTCHLGAGASLAAVHGDRSVDTTMGFTPLEGLVMATRSGSVDPGALLWLQTEHGLAAEDLRDALEHHSGLTALAGTGDVGTISARADEGHPDAGLALDVYVHRLRAGVAAMAAALGGLDALVFTGGVGENAGVVRRRTADGLRLLGVAVDPALDAGATPDAEVTAAASSVRVLVVAAREDVEIARGVRQVLGA
ncbi:MAG TPA: acetate/propionate family kinase [Acidimicrobiales bacterium]|nr:acetate/propionate family kinase [Acidimicrobiales bacterium]